jgi:hypothetical protein
VSGDADDEGDLHRQFSKSPSRATLRAQGRGTSESWHVGARTVCAVLNDRYVLPSDTDAEVADNPPLNDSERAGAPALRRDRRLRVPTDADGD